MNRIITVIDGINEWIGRGIAWCTLAMVLLTFAVVVLRYAFDIGSIAMQESIVYLHAAVFMLGAAYTLKHDAHVRVDVFYHRCNSRQRAVINIAGVLLLLIPVTAVLFFVSLDYVASAWSVREGSREPGGLPWVYLLKTLIPLAAALLFLQGVSQLLQSVQTLRKAR